MAEVKNDRAKLRTNIEGMHRLAATLTRQEVFLLSDAEATAMTDATADLFDCLGWDLTGDSKKNVYLAAFMFAATVYSIDGPRMQYFVASSRARNVTPIAPANPAEARARGTAPRGGIDFSGDIADTVNTGSNTNDGSTNGSGAYRYQ